MKHMAIKWMCNMEYQMETIPQNELMLNITYNECMFVWSHRKNNIMHYSK